MNRTEDPTLSLADAHADLFGVPRPSAPPQAIADYRAEMSREHHQVGLTIGQFVAFVESDSFRLLAVDEQRERCAQLFHLRGYRNALQNLLKLPAFETGTALL